MPRKRSGWKIDPGVAAKLHAEDREWAEVFDLSVKNIRLAKVNAVREAAEALGLKVVDPEMTPRKKPGPKPGAKKVSTGAKGKPGPKGKDKSGEQAKIRAALKGKGFVNVVSLNKQLGFKSGPAIRPLIESKEVTQRGERRSTTYKLN